MNNIKFKKIIRICRTWPTNDKRAVGLHAYYYTKFINIPTEIFLKDDFKNKSLLNLKNANFKLIKYKDLKFTSKNPNTIPIPANKIEVPARVNATGYPKSSAPHTQIISSSAIISII